MIIIWKIILSILSSSSLSIVKDKPLQAASKVNFFSLAILYTYDWWGLAIKVHSTEQPCITSFTHAQEGHIRNYIVFIDTVPPIMLFLHLSFIWMTYFEVDLWTFAQFRELLTQFQLFQWGKNWNCLNPFLISIFLRGHSSCDEDITSFHLIWLIIF